MKIFIIAVVVTAVFFYVYGEIKSIKNKKKSSANLPGHKQGIYEKYVKRWLDIFCALATMLVFGFLYIIVAILVKVKLGSPVLFKQERPGKDEIPFMLLKFRSMTSETDKNGELLPDKDRLTRFGKFLRATSLDELPEVFNILKGDMSVVGPRPLLVKYLERYTPEQRRRHEVRPGLTGYAMSTVRNSEGWNKKFELDLEYVDKISFLFDLKIIFWTIKIVLKREGINEPGEATNSEFMGIWSDKK